VRGSKRSNLKKGTFKLKIQLFVFVKNLAKQLVLITKGILKLDDSKGKTLGDESSLTSESKMYHEDFPMRQRQVKSAILRLGFSSSSELEESSLEKSRSLRAAHAQGIIFWNLFFFFFLSPKWYFFLPSPLLLELFQLL
jgi:hypothetical protein